MELPPPPGTRRVSISNPQETSGSLSVTQAVLPSHPPRLSVDPSKVSAFRENYRPSFVSSGHSGVRGPTSILQRSSLNPPEGLQGKGSNVSSVHYAEEEGKTLSAKDKDKDKEKSKGKSKGKNKGTGNRLLNMLKKTLQGSESEESSVSHETTNLIPFGDVVGCLAVHIRSCRQFSHRFIIQQHINLFIRISVNNIIKCTKLRNLKAISEKNYVLRFDEVKYFSVQVPRRQDDERNNIFLELMKDGGDAARPAHALGSAESHLYEVIQKGCFTEILQMMHRNSVICRVEVEFMFSYGSFGYGFSHQLKPLQKIIEPSMFMNIAPPPERTDPVTNVITPQRIEYPAFLSPEFNVTVGAAETSQATVVQLEKLREKPRERLEKMKEEYKNLNTWIEKSEYLKNLINPKVSNKDSKESNSSELSESSSNSLEDQHSKTHDIHHRKSESTSNEWVQSGEKEGLVIPVLRLLDQGYTEPALYKGGESAQPADALLPPIHTLQIIEEDEVPRFQRTFESEDMLYEDRKSVLFSADENLIPKCPTISKLASSLQEISPRKKDPLDILRLCTQWIPKIKEVKTKKEKVPHFSDALIIPDKSLGQENTNMKGRPSIQLKKSWERRSTDFTGGLRKVAFAQREYTTPVFRADSTEFKPKHQKPSKGGLDPFLRNINSKMSFKKKKDQDACRYSSAFSTEVLEHEDQDPPYPEHLRSAESNIPWAEESNLITIQTANRKTSLPSDPIASAVMISDRKNKLSHDPTINTPNTSSIKNIFASDNPVVTLTKLSDSDNKLSADSRFNITKPSDRRLSSDLSSRTTKPPASKLSSDSSSSTIQHSDRRLSSDPSSRTAKPSDTKLYSDHSFNTAKPSDTKLYSDHSFNTTKPSDTKLYSDHSFNTAKPLDTKLYSDHSFNTAKPSDTKLYSDHSFNTAKPSDTKLYSDHSFNTTKPSDTKLYSDHSFNTAKPSDTKLYSDHSFNTAKPSDTKLYSDHSFNTAKPSDTKLYSDHSFNTAKPSDTKLYSDHSFNTAKPSDTKLYSNSSINKLSQDPSSNATQLSDPNRLSHDPSIISTKSSDPNRLSHDPSIISRKSSETNRLSHDPSIISRKSSETNRLSHDPSIISTKSSDPNRLSQDPSIISRKSSDPNRLSHDPSIISTKSSDPNRLSHDPSIISTKSSDPIRLSHDPSIISRKSSEPNRLSLDPSITSRKSSDPNRLSHDPSIISTKSSDPHRLSHDPSIISRKSSEPNRLSHDPSITSRKSSDPNRLSHDPSIISRKSSDPHRLSHDPSIISTKSSDPNRLSHDPSIISRKSSEPNRLSHDPSIISRKSSEPNRLSHDPSIISTKSSEPNRLSQDPSIISTSLDSKDKLISGKTTVYSDATTNTAESQVTMNKLALDPPILTVDSLNRQSLYTDIDEQLPNVPLPTFQRESSVTGSLSLYCSSSSVSFTSDTENLKQSLVLRSILSKNLQDLSHELLSKSEVFTNARVTQGSCSPPSMYTRPSDGTDDRVFEKVQDIHSRLSSRDILNSQTLLSPVIRSAQDLLLEDEPGKASDADYASDKLSEAAETKFPMHRKSSLKKKHLASEASGSEQDLNGGIYDYIIKQIFTAPIFSQLGIIPKTLSEAQMVLQDQMLTPWESRESSHIVNYEEKYNRVYLSQSKSVISQIIQLFSANTFVESGIINMVDLDKVQQRPLLDTQKASPKEELQTSTEHLFDVNSQSKAPSRQNTPNSSPQDASWSGVEYTEGCQSTSKYPTPDGKLDSPTDYQRFDAEEMELRSAFDSLSSSLSKVKVTNTVMLKAFLKNIFKVFLKYSQSNGKSDTELEGPSQLSFSHDSAEHLENLQETPDEADRKPTLNPKLSVFLEKLSELEVKNLKSELSKHIQHYLVERLSESGHITKEDLPKIHQNLYQINEEQEEKGQSSFKEKYSETVEKIMSFVSNFNHCFIDKHLEAKLRSFLSEILQNYFLKNLPVSNLFNENDAMTPHPSVSSMGSECTLRLLHGLGHDTEGESFGSEGKINTNYPFSNSLQNYLNTLSENELTSIKGDLSKYLHALFLEKLYKSGLVTERQLKEISQKASPLHPLSTPLKFIKTDLPFRDESYFMKENSEEQKKYSKIDQNTTLQICLEDMCGEIEVTRRKEKGSCFSHNSKENQSTIWEQKNIYNRESKPLSFVKVQPSPNKNIQANPTSKSPERPADVALKKHKKEHYFTQLPQAENSVYRTEIQDPYIWDGGSKTIQSKTYFEKTLKVKTLDKRENHNIYKLSILEKPDTGFSPYPKLPACKVPRENENGNRLSFPTWVTHVNPENGEQSKLDQYCQKLKGNNNNNKKHLVTFAQFKNEMETLYRNPYEACNEKCTKISDSRSFKYKDNERNPRPFFFPEVLKRENMKSKRKERDHPTKPKRPFHKIVRILPATLPTTRPHLRKSVPRTLLHWTARRTVHDCFDRFEERVPSVKCPKKSKSRARLLGKSPDDPHNQAKHCARPYTAPEPNKRRECATRKFASPHMVSAGLVHIHATPEYEIRKMRSKRKLKEDIEKHSLICDIMQMLHAAQ